MSKKLKALTMERRLAAMRLANLAGKAPAIPATKAVTRPPQNGKTVLHPTPVLSLKPQ